MMRCAAIVFICLLAGGAAAQEPENYATSVRDALATPGEYLIPAPAGWDASCIGLRNVPAQRLATIDFFNDSLKSFAQTGIPQITLYDAAFTFDSSRNPVLFILAGVRRAFCLYRVKPNRSIEKIAALTPGQYHLTPNGVRWSSSASLNRAIPPRRRNFSCWRISTTRRFVTLSRRTAPTASRYGNSRWEGTQCMHSLRNLPA